MIFTLRGALSSPVRRTGGGLVEPGSIQRDGKTLDIRFVVTDTAQAIPVVYTGLLPDLFKEGKGVVAQGRLGHDGVFRATEVLAKHDENYMPPEAQEAVDKAHRAQGMSMNSLAPGAAYTLELPPTPRPANADDVKVDCTLGFWLVGPGPARGLASLRTQPQPLATGR